MYLRSHVAIATCHRIAPCSSSTHMSDYNLRSQVAIAHVGGTIAGCDGRLHSPLRWGVNFLDYTASPDLYRVDGMK